MKVEFRLLQVILSPVSGDRLTLALLHWDGTNLRVAASRTGIGSMRAPHREGVRVAMDEIVREARKRATSISRKPVLNIGLAHVFPVREGIGAALHWTAIATSITSNAEAHFAALRHELGLDRAPAARRKRITAQRIGQELEAIGEEMRVDVVARDRVRTDFNIEDKLSYRPPLSWKNGRWHHAVPLSLDGYDHAQMEREVQRVYGLVELAFPVDHVPVVVAALASGGDAADEGRRDAELLRTSLARRAVEVVVPERGDDGLVFGALVARVRRDIESQH
jgi:hypothetical protein